MSGEQADTCLVNEKKRLNMKILYVKYFLREKTGLECNLWVVYGYVQVPTGEFRAYTGDYGLLRDFYGKLRAYWLIFGL